MVLTNKQRFNKKHGQPLNQANSITKIAKLSKISYKSAKDIVLKGEGAFFSNPKSVRKSITNAQAWGVSRLYSSVMGGKAAKVDSKELAKGKKSYKK
tara:strand:+ start:48 stop:338 length:291 start_codon:yes stop_codon:yes gene_type:complete